MFEEETKKQNSEESTSQNQRVSAREKGAAPNRDDKPRAESFNVTQAEVGQSASRRGLPGDRCRVGDGASHRTDCGGASHGF